MKSKSKHPLAELNEGIPLYTRLKNEIICVSVHALIISKLAKIIRALSVHYPCIFPTLEAKTYALGVVNTAFAGRKHVIYRQQTAALLHKSACFLAFSAWKSDFDTDNAQIMYG